MALASLERLRAGPKGTLVEVVGQIRLEEEEDEEVLAAEEGAAPGGILFPERGKT